jgi:very-short-patch-repair endonuclease
MLTRAARLPDGRDVGARARCSRTCGEHPMRRVWTIARRLRKAATDAERQLWCGLRGRQLGGFRFRRQFPVGGFATGFACVEARLIVEVAPAPGDALDPFAAIRAQKWDLCGYRVLRFGEGTVQAHLDAVLDEIHRHAQASPAGRCGRLALATLTEPPRPRCPLCGG